jgi:hypothetical protein
LVVVGAVFKAVGSDDCAGLIFRRRFLVVVVVVAVSSDVDGSVLTPSIVSSLSSSLS